MYYSMHLLRYDVIMHILPVSNSPNGEFCIHFLITRCRRFFVMHVNPGRVRLEESPRWCSLAQEKHTSGHSQNLLLFCKKKFLSKPEPQLELFFLKNFRFTNFFFSPHFWPCQSCGFPHLARRLLKNVLSPWSTGAPRGHSASARSSPRPDRDPLRCKNNYRGTPGGQSNGQMCPLRPFFSFFCLVESLVCPTFPPT